MNNYKQIIKRGKYFNPRHLGRDPEWIRAIAQKQKTLSASLRNRREHVCLCPICSGGSSTKFIKIYGYQYVECNSCGHIYCSTPVSESAISELYDGEAPNRGAQALVYLAPEIFSLRKIQIAEPKVAFVEQALLTNGLLNKGLWVDVGCGTGEILSCAGDNSWSTLGIECDIEEVNFVRSLNIRVVHDSINQNNANVYLSSASVVTMINVLEHIRDPGSLLKMIVDNAPDATIALEVPRTPSLSSLVAQLFPKTAYRHIYPPDHLHIFTEQSLDLLLRQCNLERLGSWYFGQDLCDMLQNAGANSTRINMILYNSVVDAFSEMQIALDESHLSDSLFVVARRIS